MVNVAKTSIERFERNAGERSQGDKRGPVSQASTTCNNSDALEDEIPEVELAEEIENYPNSSNISLAEMVEISAVFLVNTHSLGAKFF